MSQRVSELLDIREAAALLRVSPTSLRRWTDAGKLPCFRLGGRRERRFRRADLLAFLESPPRVMPSAAGEGGADGPADRPAGHFCGLYVSDLDRTRQAAGFLVDHAGKGAVTFLVMASKVRDRVTATLVRQRPTLHADLAAGRIVLAEYASRADRQLEFWETQFTAALGAGARSLHVIGDVSGGALGKRRPFDEVLEYEAEYERSIARRFPVTTFCQYDARSLSGLETARLFHAHPDTWRHPLEGPPR